MKKGLSILLLILTILCVQSVLADHTPDPSSVTIVGSFQDELGCPGDWQPDCTATQLSYDSIDDVWQATFSIPAGAWEYKVALDDSWFENYGANAVRNGANIPLNLGSTTDVKFYYDHKSHLITDDDIPETAVVVGDFQSELGCPGDWQPDCTATQLSYDSIDDVWQATFSIPAGAWEYKVALDDSWFENYGANAVRNGANIPLNLGSTTDVKFYYDHKSHLITDDYNADKATFYSTASNGHLEQASLSYNFTHNAVISFPVYPPLTSIVIGQRKDINYHIYRGALFFDTSSLPDTAVITSATLSLYGYFDESGVVDFDITVVNGSSLHDPLEDTDYHRLLFQTISGGAVNTSGFLVDGYNDIPLNAVGMGWISKTGMTQFGLRSSDDITATPSGDGVVGIYPTRLEGGEASRPKLVVIYDTAPPTPTITPTPTVTPTIPPSPTDVPTLSQWGMIGMAIVLAAALVWSITRRWAVRTGKS